MMLTLLSISSSVIPVVLVIVVLAIAGVAALLFLPQQSKRQDALRLTALQLEQTIQRFSGPSTVEPGADERDALSIMRSTNALLNTLLERQAKQEARLEPAPTQRPLLKIQKQAQEPPAIAREIIALRDGMLLAKPKEGAMLMSAEVLDIYYQELGEILTHEDITSLDEVGGKFNQDRQHIIATQVTHDPARHNVVAQSESPGYLFHERLMRPQGVVIYKFQA